MRAMSVSLAALITVGLTACGGMGGATNTPATQAPATQAPASSAPASSTPAAPAPATTAATKAPDTSAAGGAATPEAAAEAWVKGMIDKNVQAVCDVTAIQGKPANAGGTGPACAQMAESVSQVMSSQAAMFKNAKFTKVPVNGDTADYSAATVSPEALKIMFTGYKGIKVGGKWYVQIA